MRKGDQIPVLTFDMDIDKIIDFTNIPVSVLESRIRNIVALKESDGLSDKEKTALKIFTKKISQILCWLATVDDVKTSIMYIDEDIFIPELAL